MSNVDGLLPEDSSLGTIEHFYGEAISHDLIHRICETPLDQIEELMSRLALASSDCLTDSSEPVSGSAAEQYTMPIFSHDASNWNRVENWAKCSLLYLPGPLILPDPVDAFMQPCLEYAARPQIRSRDHFDTVRILLARGTEAGVALRGSMLQGVVHTVPFDSVRSIKESASDYLASIDHYANALSEMVPVEIADCTGHISIYEGVSYFDVADALELSQENILRASNLVKDIANLTRDRSAEEDGWTFNDSDDPNEWEFDERRAIANDWSLAAGILGARPVAADDGASEFRQFQLSHLASRYVSTRDANAARLFGTMAIPGPVGVSFDDIIDMRQDVEEFPHFRSAFARAVDAVSADSTWSSRNTGAEMGEELARELGLRLKSIQQVRSRNRSLEGVLTAAFSLGASAIEAQLTGIAPVGSLLAVAAMTGGWLLPAAAERAQANDRRRKRLVFYTRLIGG